MVNMRRNLKKSYRETFKVGDEVRVAKSENLVGKPKEWRRRFVEMGIVKVPLPKDSYLVKIGSDKLVKQRHYDLKLTLSCC